ncbi:MAG TPA: alanine racemase [Actinomycetota bacterium]|nr:alanine racemase [Actinomycetota bacterium]
MNVPRPAWADIDLAAIRRNVSRVAAGLTPNTKVMAVVKANAYGHGDVEVARAALEAGASWCGVILVDEALRLRAGGVEAPILLLHEPPAERMEEALRNDLTPVVFTRKGIEAVSDAAAKLGRSAAVHLKLDTGLNRLGCPPDQLVDIATALSKESHVEVHGLMTHFAFADEPANPVIDAQLERFADMCERLRALGIEPQMRHVGNSAAAITRPDAHFDMIRLGIAMYGLSPGPQVDGHVELQPAMQLKARIAQVKRCRAGDAVSYGHRYRLEHDGTIVSIPLGYADGWPRALTNNAHVLIGGKRYPAVGTVTMDSFLADIGNDTCEIGDEVVLIGTQGEERITADEVAARLGTINYEVVTRISTRIPRVFHG